MNMEKATPTTLGIIIQFLNIFRYCFSLSKHSSFFSNQDNISEELNKQTSILNLKHQLIDL